jgi:ketosteroid isomerase-like protein
VDDVLGVESAWTGTNDGTVDPVIKRPTHRTAGAAVMTLSWLTPDGRIREQHVYGDQGIVASELGGTGRPFDGLPTTRERHEAKRTPVEESNVELVRGAFASPPTLAFSDDAELTDFTRASFLPRKTTGGRWIGARTSGLSNAHVVVTHLWGVEDSVLCEYEATGTPKDAKPQASATVHGVEVLRIEEGRVTRAVRYEDSLELSPPPGLPPPLPSMAP